MLRIAQSSAIFSAFFTTLMLKGFHLFEFIEWKPTTFLKTIPVPFFRYVVLFLILYVIAWVLYLIACPLRYVAVAAILAAILITIVVECVIMQREISWGNISFSFFVLTIVNCRFIMETASFHFRRGET